MTHVAPTRFPDVAARDLTGRDVSLPEAFAGDRNVVVVAFRRQQQRTVDSWVPWLEARSDEDPGLRFYEVPAISGRWSTARPFIDGGMATAIRDPDVLRRTMTVYGDLRRLTDPLEIADRDTVSLFVVSGDGLVSWVGTGPFDDALADELGAALEASSAEAGVVESDDAAVSFPFEFDPRFRTPLALIGVTHANAHATVTADRLVVRFGPWSLDTGLDNVDDVCVTRGYRWYRAIGARGSLADGGLTFGSNIDAGACVRFIDPVPRLLPMGLLRHPGATLTLADPEQFAAVVRARSSAG